MTLVEDKKLTEHGDIMKDVLDGIYELTDAEEFIGRLNDEYGKDHIKEFFQAINKH